MLGLAVVAGLIGVAAGYGIAAALLPDLAASLRGLYGARVAGDLRLAPSWWLAGIGISLGGALAATAGSLWRAWSLPPLAVAQPGAWLRSQRRARRAQLAAAVVLAAGGLAALLFGRDLAAGFAVMGGLLLAAALALPALLAGLLAAAERAARRPMTQWLWADTRQQLSGLSMALMALLLAPGGEYRRRHDGRQLSRHLPRLARPTARLRALRHADRRRSGGGGAGLAAQPAGSDGDPADRRAPTAGFTTRRCRSTAFATMPPIATTGHCWHPRQTPGTRWRPAAPR